MTWSVDFHVTPILAENLVDLVFIFEILLLERILSNTCYVRLNIWFFHSNFLVFDLIYINYNAEKKYLNEVKKLEKIWQDQQTLISAFVLSFTDVAKVLFLEEIVRSKLSGLLCPHLISRFFLCLFAYFLLHQVSLFELFGNSLGNLKTKFKFCSNKCQVPFYLQLLIFVLKNFDQDCRFN